MSHIFRNFPQFSRSFPAIFRNWFRPPPPLPCTQSRRNVLVAGVQVLGLKAPSPINNVAASPRSERIHGFLKMVL